MQADVVAIAMALAFLAGLWTPVIGSLIAVLAAWKAFSEPADLRADIFIATIGLALALLGPGAWSVDARLFGWRRIDVRERRS
jgi:uncharacterized membrane protein YphA (DoxX/SURF4 family)